MLSSSRRAARVLGGAYWGIVEGETSPDSALADSSDGSKGPESGKKLDPYAVGGGYLSQSDAHGVVCHLGEEEVAEEKLSVAPPTMFFCRQCHLPISSTTGLGAIDVFSKFMTHLSCLDPPTEPSNPRLASRVISFPPMHLFPKDVWPKAVKDIFATATKAIESGERATPLSKFPTLKIHYDIPETKEDTNEAPAPGKTQEEEGDVPMEESPETGTAGRDDGDVLPATPADTTTSEKDTKEEELPSQEQRPPADSTQVDKPNTADTTKESDTSRTDLALIPRLKPSLRRGIVEEAIWDAVLDEHKISFSSPSPDLIPFVSPTNLQCARYFDLL